MPSHSLADRFALDRPIRLVTFDLYDTLMEADPPRWERLTRALRRAGFAVEPEAVLRHDRAGEDYYTAENGRWPIRDRPAEEQEAFRLRYMQAALAALDLPADPETARRVRQHFLDETEIHGWDYRVFPDVLPALSAIKEAGVKRAIISNADADVTAVSFEKGFGSWMDLIVTSALVGWEKPDERTFHAALDPLGIDAADALHVGDQAGSDVFGSRRIGMSAALIDRYDRHADDEHDAIRVRSLTELADLVIAHNDLFAVAG